jgi:hypothetical protein
MGMGIDFNTKNEFGVDRFTLEDAMIQVTQTQDDLKLIMDNIYDGITVYSVDKVANAVYGLVELMEARTKHMEEVYAKLFKLDQYSSVERQRKWEAYWDSIDDAEDFPDNVRDEGLIVDGDNVDGC